MQVGFWIFRYSLVNLLVPKARLRLDARKAKRLIIPLGFLGAITFWLSLTNRLNLPQAYGYMAFLVTKFTSLSVGLLYLYYLNGELTPKEKLAFVTLLVITELLSVASSNFRVIIDPPLVMAVVYWMVKRKFPWTFFAIGALLFGILQPVKSEYRLRVWKNGYSEGSVGGRLALWGELLGANWYGVLHGRHGAVEQSARGSLSRTDIIHMFSRVLSMTPRFVPYQHGDTYSYLLYALIPARPVAGEARIGIRQSVFRCRLRISRSKIGRRNLDRYSAFARSVYQLWVVGRFVYHDVDRDGLCGRRPAAQPLGCRRGSYRYLRGHHDHPLEHRNKHRRGLRSRDPDDPRVYDYSLSCRTTPDLLYFLLRLRYPKGCMNVAHVVPSFYPATAYGGPLESVYALCRSVGSAGCRVRVLTTDADGRRTIDTVEKDKDIVLAENVEIRYCKRWWPESISPSLLSSLHTVVSWADVVHLTAVYSFPTIPTLKICKAMKKPVVWSPRGALERWGGTRRQTGKAVWESGLPYIFSRSRLVLHVTSEEEGQKSLMRFPGLRLAVI